MFKAKKAQSTLEYIIIFSVIIVAVFVLAYGILRESMQNLLTNTSAQIEEAVVQFAPNPQ